MSRFSGNLSLNLLFSIGFMNISVACSIEFGLPLPTINGMHKRRK